MGDVLVGIPDAGWRLNLAVILVISLAVGALIVWVKMAQADEDAGI